MLLPRSFLRPSLRSPLALQLPLIHQQQTQYQYHTSPSLQTTQRKPITLSCPIRTTSTSKESSHPHPSIPQRRSISYVPWRINGSFVSRPTLALAGIDGAWGGMVGQKGGERGMKVRSSVKKLCDGCKVCYVFGGVVRGL